MFFKKKILASNEVINLGDLVKDKITGFEGVVECISEWLNACRRITVRPTILKDGLPIDSHTFDEPQLDIVKAGYIDLPKFNPEEKTGGPSIKPARRNDPI